MELKQFKLKTLLVAVSLIVGSMSAWAETYYSESYSSESTIEGWSTSTAGRSTPTILSDGDNYFMSINQDQRGHNGAVVTGTVLQGKVTAGNDFTISFRLKLGGSNQNVPSFWIYDAANSAAIFSLTETAANATTWKVNNSSEQIVTLEGTNTGYSNKSLSDNPWYSVTVTRKGTFTYLTIRNAENNDVFTRALITGETSSTGGVGKIVFNATRSVANFAIDDIVLRDVEDGDVPQATATTYTVNYLNSSDDSPIKDADVINTIAGIEVNADAQAFDFTEGDQRYIYVSGNTTITTDEDGSSNVINLVFREAVKYDYSIVTSLGETLKSGSEWEGVTVSYRHPRYQVKDGVLYEKTASSDSNKDYKISFTMPAENHTETLTYNSKGLSNIVYYKEAETIEYAGWSVGDGNSTRASAGLGGYGNVTDMPIGIELAAGKYKITAAVNGGTTCTFTFNVGDYSISTTGSFTETSKEFELTETTNITVSASGTANNKTLDYIVIQQIPQVAPALTLDKTSASVNASEAVSFTATVTAGSPEPTLQWYSCDDAEKTNAAAIDGETSATYSPSTSEPGTYYYFVRATNSVGSTDSEVITLTVTGTCAVPTITIGSYNYEEGGYAITANCATEGATLTYTIGDGAAQACTAGVPFYAKNGKVVVKASKEGWTDATLDASSQYVLNVAPSATSPETLIAFQKTTDNGDKNIEHKYKSVTIAGGSDGPIAGRDGNGRLKLRTNQNSSDTDNTITLSVNAGYEVTNVTIKANSNDNNDITLTSVKVDSGDNIMSEGVAFKKSGDAISYSTGTIASSSSIVLTFDNGSASTKQILAEIIVTYKTPAELAVEAAIADCKANETSAAFATYIDGESFSTAEEVYAAHTAWQIENGTLSGGKLNITKAIRNAAIADGTDWNGVRTINLDQQYTGAPENCFIDANDQVLNTNQTVYGVPAGSYIVRAATRAAEKIYGHLYVNDGSSDVTTVAINAVGNTGGTLDNGWSWSEMTFTLTETKNLLIGFYTDATGGWSGCDTWEMYKIESVTAPITSSTGYATFSSTYALDFSGVTDLTAWIATACDGETVTMQQVTGTVAANTGLVIKGTTADIPVVATGDTQSENLLFALDGSYSELGAGTGGTNYVLSVQNEKVVFAPITSDAAPVTAGHAALFVPTSGARALKMLFGSETTGISAIDKAEQANGVYNLSGQRVSKPTKGLYIVGGKKVIVK